MKTLDIVEIMRSIQEDQKQDLLGLGEAEIENYIRKSDYKYSVVLDDGTPIASFGVNKFDKDDFGRAWGVVSVNAGKHFLYIHKAVLEFLNKCPYNLVRMTVRKDFKRGIRWAKMLDFEQESIIKNMCKNGDDAVVFYRSK